VNADRPTPAEPRRLGEDQGMPGDFLVGFTHRLMDRRQQLLGDGHPPGAARELAVAEAVQAFHAAAGHRGWTVTQRRTASLAADILEVEDEYRDRHGYEPELARLYAVGEVLEAERLRGEIPRAVVAAGRPPQRPDPTHEPPPLERTGPDTVRTREAGRER
jgi:hypothetical protein